MVVKIPTNVQQNIAKLSSTPSARLSSTGSGLSVGNELRGVGKTLNILSVAKGAREEASATEKYNQWKEDIAPREQELNQTRGSDAVGLSDKLDEESKGIIDGIEFDSDSERKKFSQMTDVSMSSKKTGLNKYEVKESFASLSRQKAVVMANSADDAIAGVASGNPEAVDEAFVQYTEAHKSMNPGIDESVRIRDVTTKFSKSISSQLNTMSNFNPTSAATNALKMKKKGYLTEADYQGVIAVSRPGYMKALSASAVEEAMNNPENKFKTLSEVSGKESTADDSSTNISLPYKERMRRVGVEVSEGMKTNDPIYGDISKELSVKMNSDFEKLKKAADVEHENFVDDSKSQYLNIKAAVANSTSTVDKAAGANEMAQISANLREEGEFDLAKELEDNQFKTRESDPGTFTKASNDITSGRIYKEGQLAKYMPNLNAGDYEKLTTIIRNNSSNQLKEDTKLAQDSFRFTTYFQDLDKDPQAERIAMDAFLRIFNDENNKVLGAADGEPIPASIMNNTISIAMAGAIRDVDSSRETIRGSFEKLVEAGVDIRSSGRAVSVDAGGSETEDVVQKIRIARRDLQARVGVNYTDQDVLNELKVLYDVPEGFESKSIFDRGVAVLSQTTIGAGLSTAVDIVNPGDNLFNRAGGVLSQTTIGQGLSTVLDIFNPDDEI